MFILYKRTTPDIDSRFRFIDQFWGLTLVEVGNPEWIDWSTGNPKIVPDEYVTRFNDFGRPYYKAYRNLSTGEEFPTKAVAGTYEKVEREYTAEESANSVGYMKTVLKARVEYIYEGRFRELQLTSTKDEMSTWPQQRIEAEAGGGTLIDAIAEARGISTSVLIDKIKEKAAAYDLAVGTLLGEQKRHIDDIDACETLEEVVLVAEDKFGIPRHPDLGTALKSDYRIHI